MARPVELYELVGRGRSHLLSGSYFELPAAVDAFRSAIEIDPTYAPAHAGLARARCLQAVFRAVPHQEAFAEAKASALRALAMDSASADAQVALGTVLFLSEWDWTAAERSLQRALQINPDHTEALCSMGRSRKRSGGSTTGCDASNRRSRAIRDRPGSGADRHLVLASTEVRRHARLDSAGAGDRPESCAGGQFINHVYWKDGDVDGFAAWILRVTRAIEWGFSEERWRR
jgi:tetratricopeptide (TPR) repeat protein